MQSCRPLSLLIACLLGLAPALAAAAPDATRQCRSENKGVALASERVQWLISPCLGGVESIKLLEGQFNIDLPNNPPGVPEWAQPKYAAGGLQLVDTWDAKWDPFRDTIVDVSVGKVEVATRSAAGKEPVTRKTWPDFASFQAAHPRWAVHASDKTSVTLIWPDPAVVGSPIYMLKRYKLAEARLPYALEVKIEVWNVGAAPAQFKLRHTITRFHDRTNQQTGLLSMLKGPPDLKGAGFHLSGETVHLDTGSLPCEAPKCTPDEATERSRAGAPAWFYVDSRYFGLITLPGKGWGKRSLVRIGELSNGVIESVLKGEGEALPAADGACVPAWYATHWGGNSCAADFAALGLEGTPADEIKGPFMDAARQRAGEDMALKAAIDRVLKRRVTRVALTIYTGPKRLEYLEAMGADLGDSIDFGWFGLIARPLLSVLKFAQGLTGSWVLAILILTVLVKLALWPITTKSMRSMYKMQRLKPELEKIKVELAAEATKRGEDKPDPQELNKQTFALYKRHGVNPLGGCLPMFIQMPVYIALYRTIYSSVELFNQPLFAWVTDLTQKDPFYVLPVLLGVTMFGQQMLMPNPGGDQTQRKMLLYGMPVMFSLMMMSLPSGLTFYILVNTVLSGVQTYYLKRAEQKAAV